MFLAQDLRFLREERVLIEKLSFNIEPGQGILLSGENGSGKSTLLKILAGFIKPFAGKIVFQNEMIQDSEAFAKARFFLGHSLGLKTSLTLTEMVNFFLAFRGISSTSTTVQDILNKVHLQAEKNALIRTFSAGQQQKLALSLAFASEATLLLLDEPTSHLDTSGQDYCMDALKTHLAQGGMVIMSSHQPDLFANLPLTQLTLGQIHA